MTFYEWWTNGGLSDDCSFAPGSTEQWAWQGWQAGVAAEKERCAALADVYSKANEENDNAVLIHLAAEMRGAPSEKS